MTRRYAEGTTVEVADSMAEIRRILRRLEATNVMTADLEDGQHILQFQARKRWIRMSVKQPDPTQFAKYPSGATRTTAQLREAVEAETRRRWRVMVLTLKAKVEAVLDETLDFQQEFLPYILIDGTETFGDRYTGQVDKLYEAGSLPNPLTLLLGAPRGTP